MKAEKKITQKEMAAMGGKKSWEGVAPDVRRYRMRKIAQMPRPSRWNADGPTEKTPMGFMKDDENDSGKGSHQASAKRLILIAKLRKPDNQGKRLKAIEIAEKTGIRKEIVISNLNELRKAAREGKWEYIEDYVEQGRPFAPWNKVVFDPSKKKD